MSGGADFRGLVKPEDGRPRLPGSLHTNRRLSQWITFHADGRVTIRPGKVELGQGILTALAQIAADELDVSLGRIRVQPAATPDSPNEGVTSGSLSVQDCGTALRHACANARAIHLSVAAQKTGVPLEALRVEDGAFLGPAGPVGSYWAQADDALLECEASPEARPKPPAARRVAGTSAPRLDLPDKVFGAARFVHDLRLPGMLHARVVRPPARGARLAELREGPPLPGGARVVRDGSFLAVLAEAEHDAEAAAARIAGRARWEEADTLPDEGALADWLREAPHEHSVVVERVANGAAQAAHTVRGAFFRPPVAHASVGTSCAVARWSGETVEVWTHSQGVYNLRTDLAKVLRVAPERIIVRHAEGAGCYGHNGADDVALDAALVARAVPGRPVRVLWSRAEELGWSPFSPAMLVEVEASADAAGNLASWRCGIIGNGHSSRPGRLQEPTLLSGAYVEGGVPVPPSINPPLAGGGGAERNAVPLYRVPDLRVAARRLTEMPLRTSALRGLGAPVNVWAIESTMDELAARAGADPVEYRLRHLDDPRAAEVVRAAAEMAGWAGRARREGAGMGVGFARYKNAAAWCAVVAEVAAEATVRATRLWIAADVGEAINPDGVANQVEGGALHGVSMALKEAVRFDRRRVTSDSWETYPILRFSEVPAVEVRLLQRPDEPPLGAGECALAPTVAALAGAIRDALGVRVRAMPFTAENIAAAMDAG
ncbi:xanthine dehydrogenase family protein molybdopterin-binding subunit [Caldovatus sediminis]|uniref:xanthine dehydrogenase family protein molybdopterin-binding subunit n=1 Tax=Caldovatus sediminis TaxID=2041189 RepID=UPI00166852B3|nr:molybdopterin cofactor-binding domain-containing protein [Caldovatus sediminis]